MEPACIKTTRHPGGVHGRDEFQEYRFQVSVTHPRLAAQLRQCAVGDQSAFGDDANPFGHTFRDFQYMGRHDNLRIALHLPNEDILHHSRRHSVLPGQQLVQKISFVFCTNTTANATFGRTLLENHASVRAHWSQGAAYRSVREFGGRGRQFPEPSDGFKILKRRDFFIKHRLLQHPGDQKFCRQRVLQRIDSKYLDGALVQPQQSGNHLQRRGFAHAIGSDQRLNSPDSTRSFKP